MRGPRQILSPVELNRIDHGWKITHRLTLKTLLSVRFEASAAFHYELLILATSLTGGLLTWLKADFTGQTLHISLTQTPSDCCQTDAEHRRVK